MNNTDFEDGCDDPQKEAAFLEYSLTTSPAITTITADVLRRAWNDTDFGARGLGGYNDKINFILRRLPDWIEITAQYSTVYDYCPVNYPKNPLEPEKNVAIYVEPFGSNHRWLVTDLGESHPQTSLENVVKIDLATDDTVSESICKMLLSIYKDARIK